MSNFREDQAAGLRRIMTGQKPKLITVLNATANQTKRGYSQPFLLSQLANNIHHQGGDVLVVCATNHSSDIFQEYGLENCSSLFEMAIEKSTLARSIKTTKLGFSITKLLPETKKSLKLSENSDLRLNLAFKQLSHLYDVVLIDANISNNQALPLSVMYEGDIIIRLSKDQEVLKEAYWLMKMICSQIGRRSFGILVDNANDIEAASVFRHIAKVAKDFMQIELEFLGAIPTLNLPVNSIKLRGPVTDMLPLTNATKEFKAISQRVYYPKNQQLNTELASLM